MRHSRSASVRPALITSPTAVSRPVPDRLEEVDLQLDRRERLAVVESREVRAAHRAVCEVAEDAAVERPGRARMLRPGVELERHAPCLGRDHAHPEQLRDRRARRLARDDPLQDLERHGMSTVRITSPLCIASSASCQSSSGAVRVTMPARSSLPSSAHCARRGKSSCGRWSPPCETRIRRAASRTARAARAPHVSPAGERPIKHDRAARRDHPERLLEGRAAPDDVEDEVDPARARRAWRRTAAPARACARRDRSRGSRPRRRCARPGSTDSPTAPHPITATRAPSQTFAVSSTDITPVATAQPMQARLLDRQLARHLHGGSDRHDGVRRERAGAQNGRQLAAVGAEAAARAPPAGGCSGAARRAGRWDIARTRSSSRARPGRRSRARRLPRRPPRPCPRPRARAARETRGPSRPPRSRADRCGRPRSPRCERAPRPARAARPGSPRARPRRGPREDYAAVDSHERSSSRIDVRAGEREREVDLGHQVLDQLLDARAARRRRARRRTGGRAAPRRRRARPPSARRPRNECRRPSARPHRAARRAPRRARRALRPRRRPGGRRGSRRRRRRSRARARARASSAVSTPLTSIGSVVCCRAASRGRPTSARGSGRSRASSRRR